MKTFLDENFLLENEVAAMLYHEYAAPMPIIDYHNHLPPADIADDRQFENLSQIWLAGDHYKWRAMRTMGVDEKYITGDATDQEKMQQWAATVPYTMRNPLYHWTHMELKNYFEVHDLLLPENADAIYEHATELLQGDDYRTRPLLRRMNVEVVCTTDDPVDDLQHHIRAAKEDMGFKMLPAFRPDKLLNVGGGDTFVKYLNQFGEAANINIDSLDTLLQALDQRMDFFHANDCRLSDHGLNQMYAAPFTDRQLDQILKQVLAGRPLTREEIIIFRSGMLYHFGIRYHERGWTQQFHLGALRNNSTRMQRELGPDTGFDSIGDWDQAVPLSRFLDRLDNEDQLSKTILYNLNPRDNEVLASMIGNFNDGSVRGKMQFGSGWWYLDQKDGMEKQMNALSNLGLLSQFIGMLTDSRSFLSFPRHEYFRRILCNLFGQDVQQGLLPNDIKWLGKLIQDICYNNAKQYFNF
ncbi:MAG: glucuronate isomerase [Bacteroidota bacterium]